MYQSSGSMSSISIGTRVVELRPTSIRPRATRVAYHDDKWVISRKPDRGWRAGRSEAKAYPVWLVIVNWRHCLSYVVIVFIVAVCFQCFRCWCQSYEGRSLWLRSWIPWSSFLTSPSSKGWSMELHCAVQRLHSGGKMFESVTVNLNACQSVSHMGWHSVPGVGRI